MGRTPAVVPPAIVFAFLSFQLGGRTVQRLLVLGLVFTAMLIRAGDIGWSLLRMSAEAERQIPAPVQTGVNARIYTLLSDA